MSKPSKPLCSAPARYGFFLTKIVLTKRLPQPLLEKIEAVQEAVKAIAALDKQLKAISRAIKKTNTGEQQLWTDNEVFVNGQITCEHGLPSQ